MPPAKQIRLNVPFADLHSGSIHAPLAKDFITEDGNKILPNRIQEWLNNAWEESWDRFFKQIRKGDPWCAVFNGDVIEGNHHRTTEIIHGNVSEHIRCALQLLYPKLESAHAVYFVDGTECHTGTAESGIAKMLKDKGVNVVMSEHSGSWPELNLEMCGQYCHFAHHMGTTSRPYLEASGIGINMNVLQLEQARAKHRLADIVIRSHRHRYGHVSDGHTMGLVTYPWQVLTRHGRKVVTNAKPEVGLAVMDWRQREDGDMPAIWEIAHTVKAPTIQKL